MLDVLWDGPFETIWHVSPFTYEEALPKRCSKYMVALINSLMEWNTRDASLLHLVVVGEEIELPQID